MAAASPTSYTDKVLVTDEIAEFSPAVVEEMRSHLTKYPAERSRSALIPLLFVVQRHNLVLPVHFGDKQVEGVGA